MMVPPDRGTLIGTRLWKVRCAPFLSKQTTLTDKLVYADSIRCLWYWSTIENSERSAGAIGWS